MEILNITNINNLSYIILLLLGIFIISLTFYFKSINNNYLFSMQNINAFTKSPY